MPEMIEQLIRSIEMELLKQSELMTGHQSTSSMHRAPGHGLGPKTELWVDVKDEDDTDRQFKVIIEEIIPPEK